MSILTTGDPTTSPSFSLVNRLSRFAWAIIWAFFFRPSPRPLHAWRNFLLRIFQAKIGKNVHIYTSVRIWAPWNLEVEDGVGIGDGANIYSMGKIKIGTRAVISQGAHLCAGTHDINSPRFQLVVKNITIGPKSWICAEAFIGPGVSIADGCVIGARAVVFKSIENCWTVWSGNPAKIIKTRSQH